MSTKLNISVNKVYTQLSINKKNLFMRDTVSKEIEKTQNDLSERNKKKPKSRYH